MPFAEDTIVAIATPPQNGAVGIVRLSGKCAERVLARVFVRPDGERFASFKPRYFHYGHIITSDGEILDQGLAVYMPGPASFTGEDVVEIHAHGNVLLLRRILSRLLSLAPEFQIRAAEAGEFTRRAFLNGKMDLARAEAVNEVIVAESDAALRASLANLDGRLSREVSELRDALRTALALVEASFEFSEEDIQTFDRAQVLALLTASRDRLGVLLEAYRTSKLYDHGISVVLAGRPNVGKSSLLNAILAEDRAIVTDRPGTTRDVVEGAKILSGLRFVFRDTAGLRSSTEPIEQAGISRTHEWIDRSDVVFWVTDDPQGEPPFLEKSNQQGFLVFNKIDLLPDSQRGNLFNKCKQDDELQNDSLPKTKQWKKVLVSARTGEGLKNLLDNLVLIWSKQNSVQNIFHVNERQRGRLEIAKEAIERIIEIEGVSRLTEDLLAEELRIIIDALLEVTGQVTSEDVLGEVFKRFCIGK